MQLRALVDQIPVVSVNGTLDREITGITHDSRRITPGMVFVALTGQRADGIEFIGNAIERGAAAVICDRQTAAPARTAYIKVADARAALARASAAYYEWPATKLKVIGITGTNGKTTVSFLVKQLLEAAGIATGLIGTVRYEIGERIIPAQRTTPEAPDLQQMMAQMVRAGCRACVMEVSSHALEQKRVGGIEFDVAIFTNLTQDHLDYHPTMEAYFAAKQQLFGMLRRSSGREAAVINIDDVYGNRLAQEAQAGILLSYGINETALIHATDIRLGREDTEMRVHLPGGGFACRLPLIGRHNVYNALAAVGAGVALEIDASLIRSALHMARPVPGRLEAVAEGQPFGIFVDYAHTPDALENVLRTVREICSGRLLLAFGCGGSRDPGKRPQMGEVAARLADFTIITSDNPRRESPADIAREIAAGFARVRADGFTVELDRRRGIELALQMAQPHDCVLIAGKGHETYQEFEDTVVPFDDRLCAVEVLDTLGYHA